MVKNKKQPKKALGQRLIVAHVCCLISKLMKHLVYKKAVHQYFVNTSMLYGLIRTSKKMFSSKVYPFYSWKEEIILFLT